MRLFALNVPVSAGRVRALLGCTVLHRLLQLSVLYGHEGCTAADIPDKYVNCIIHYCIFLVTLGMRYVCLLALVVHDVTGILMCVRYQYW
jgi:hypothetical protein